jgi:hypothetical protein
MHSTQEIYGSSRCPTPSFFSANTVTSFFPRAITISALNLFRNFVSREGLLIIGDPMRALFQISLLSWLRHFLAVEDAALFDIVW